MWCTKQYYAALVQLLCKALTQSKSKTSNESHLHCHLREGATLCRTNTTEPIIARPAMDSNLVQEVHGSDLKAPCQWVTGKGPATLPVGCMSAPCTQQQFQYTLSLRAFSYLAKSLSDLNVELAASQTYLKSFWLMGSFQKANHVTVLSWRTSFHCWPGYGCSGVGSPTPVIQEQLL